MLKVKKIKHRKNKFKIFLFFCLLTIIFSFLFIFFLKNINIYSFGKKNFISPLGQDLKLQKIDFADKKIKNVESLLEKNGISFSSVEIASGSSFLIKITNSGEAVLSSEKPLENQVSSLQLILSRLTIEGKRFERLDFRFDRPVIILK